MKTHQMFNVINGLNTESNAGKQHLKKYPEDEKDIIEKYNKFIKHK